MNVITLVLSKFRNKLLAANHVTVRQRTKFDNEQKSSTLLLEIMTLISSANKTGSDKEFILWGRSFIQTMNKRGPRIYAWGTLMFQCTPAGRNIPSQVT
jgi:hypothetical protein